MERVELFNDHFQNSKVYGIPKAQLIIADIPYNVGINAYGSNPSWYEGGDNKNGESELAGKTFFDTDVDFRIPEFLHFCSKMLKPEPKEKGKAPCMIVFCSFEQQFILIEEAKKHGLNNYINLVFRKNFSAQVLKANMRVVGNAEYAILLYRDKLPKFNNNGRMVFNVLDWPRETETVKIHPCLPAGEKVYFNNKWVRIETVKNGDKNEYGKVIETTIHNAEKLITLISGRNKTKATYNHPFLICKRNEIFWKNAENVKVNDLTLSLVFAYNTQKPIRGDGIKCLNLLKKVMFVTGKEMTEGYEWNIVLFGKIIMEKFRQVCKFIIGILTKRIIVLETSNLSVPLNINGYTKVANLTMRASGKNRVQYAENINHVQMNSGTFQEGGLTGNYAKNVSPKNLYRYGIYLLRKVGSVKTISQKTKVYNLTMSDIPAFETKIGTSHNTQKPVALLEQLIEIFTDEDEVIIDPVAGSGSTLIAAQNTNRKAYGFEIKKEFCKEAQKWIALPKQKNLYLKYENKKHKQIEMEIQ